jgi:hypothetical protein
MSGLNKIFEEMLRLNGVGLQKSENMVKIFYQSLQNRTYSND